MLKVEEKKKKPLEKNSQFKSDRKNLWVQERDEEKDLWFDE